MINIATEKGVTSLHLQRMGPHRLSLRSAESPRSLQDQRDEYAQSLHELEIAYATMRGEEKFPNQKWSALQRQRIEYQQSIEWAQQQPEATVGDILGTDSPQRTLVELQNTLTPHPELDLLLLVLLQHEAEIRDIQSSKNTHTRHHRRTTRAELHEYLTTAAAFMSDSQQRLQYPVLWHSLELACTIAAETYWQKEGEIYDTGTLLDLVKIGLVEDHRLIRLRNAKRHWDPYSLEVETIGGLRKTIRDAITFEDTRPQQVVTIKRPDTFEEIMADEPNLFLPIERKIKAAAQTTRDLFRGIRKRFTRSDTQNGSDDTQPADEVSAIKDPIKPQTLTGTRRSYGDRFKPSTTSNRDSVMNIPA